MNWLAVTIITIWITATIGATTTKDNSCYCLAFLTTFFIGLGYFLLNWFTILANSQ